MKDRQLKTQLFLSNAFQFLFLIFNKKQLVKKYYIYSTFKRVLGAVILTQNEAINIQNFIVDPTPISELK